MNDLDQNEKLRLTQLVVSILTDWGVSSSQQVILLGMPEETRSRNMSKYNSSNELPETGEIYTRVEHIIGIADALRTSYPRNEQMGNFWVNKKNKRFSNRTPLTCMLADGLNGIVSVRVHLDCSYDWQIDESRAGKI